MLQKKSIRPNKCAMMGSLKGKHVYVYTLR